MKLEAQICLIPHCPILLAFVLSMLFHDRISCSGASAFLQVLLDLSCGSGLFSRRFLQSGQFEKVIASDFSEQMLQQASRFFFEDVKLDRR